MKKIEEICGIYAIVNTKNGKKYIGLSKHCKLRKKQHFNKLRKNGHSNIHFQNAFNYYGEDSFEFVILEECSPEDLVEREIYWIKYYDTFKHGYNRTGGGDGTANVIFSEERSEKLRKAMTGKKLPQNSGSNAHNARKIVCLNTGKVYECIKYAEEELGVSTEQIIGSCKKYCTAGKQFYVFVYYEDYIQLNKGQIEKIIEDAVFHRKHSNSRKVICLNTLEVFKGAKEAAKYYNIDNSYLSKCCKGEVASAGKDNNNTPLTWMNFDEYFLATDEEILKKIKMGIKKGKHNIPKKLLCVETGEIFQSKSEVCKKYNTNHRTFNSFFDKNNNQYILERNGQKLSFKLI